MLIYVYVNSLPEWLLFALKPFLVLITSLLFSPNTTDERILPRDIFLEIMLNDPIGDQWDYFIKNNLWLKRVLWNWRQDLKGQRISQWLPNRSALNTKASGVREFPFWNQEVYPKVFSKRHAHNLRTLLWDINLK